MFELFQNWLIDRGFNPEFADMTLRVTAVLGVATLSVLANLVAKRYLLSGLQYLISRTKTTWDDTFLRRNVFNRLAHLAPAAVVYLLIPPALGDLTALVSTIKSAVLIYMIIVIMLAIDAFLNSIEEIYRNFEVSRKIPIKGFVQVLKIILYFLGGIFVISIVLNKTPVYFLSGLGALTAVLMFIFKDAILGFVAGIQLIANKMLARGDWIEMPKYGADGDVIEITLTTVKVQNWDKTVTTIPTYALISESFKNWRGMENSGGRRIKRAINIDLNSIKFCDEEMLARFAKVQHISEYIAQKKEKLLRYNEAARVDSASLANGRRMTNIGVFRAYVVAYLKGHPMINQEMTFLVRQLKPTENGLPIEIYVFCKDKRWAFYEGIQADIFDHILAVVPLFDLRVFQRPTGLDFQSVSAGLQAEAAN